MNSKLIRQKFFDFFEERGHNKVASSSLIPTDDPTLLFTNAGMNQFKDIFLGKEKRSYQRAVSIQKCVRAGGKHNDLDNVGFTQRHLTFFEMMGNFSFGDYFKKEAIQFAWEFLTKIMELPAEKLYASVFKSDDESFDIWNQIIGLPKEKIYRLGAKDNFWQMGETGPCGPCAEIHIDRGSGYGCKNIDECGPGCECDRFIEIWNLVFMQYDRQQDGTDKPLKKKGVDTGMGFERLCMISQGKDSVFDIDNFLPIRNRIEELTGKKFEDQDNQLKSAFHVIEDHIRSSTFLIADGCMPSNEGRGYVLRKIIRRAALFALKLTDKDIFPALSRVVIDEMGDVYPELRTHENLIVTTLRSEVQRFSANLIRGKRIFEEYLQSKPNEISGEQAFKMYDTFGFPLELLTVIAREQNVDIDLKGFEEEMQKQQERSGKKVGIDELDQLAISAELSTEFIGYDSYQTESSITALILDNQMVENVKEGDTCWIITKESPFFVIGGGQEPDKGWITIDGKKTDVNDVRYVGNGIAVEIKAPVDMAVGDLVLETVDEQFRKDIMRNHTATHLLQSALIELFGNNIKQAGSFVGSDHLRFDFNYHGSLSSKDIKKIEDIVNKKVRENIPVCVEYMTLDQAKKKGVLAFFGEKYKPEQVRVVQVPAFSAELCCGTHVRATGDIGVFKITEEKALAAGQRRIVAVTGCKAVKLFQHDFDVIKVLSNEYKVPRESVLDSFYVQKEQVHKLQSDIKKLRLSLRENQMPLWESQVSEVNGIPFLFLELEGSSHAELKEIIQRFQKKRPGLYVFLSNDDGSTIFLATLAKRFENKFSLKDLASWLKDEFGLRGGGSTIMIQGGGESVDKKVSKNIFAFVKEKLK